jgi:hypothetical protein
MTNPTATLRMLLTYAVCVPVAIVVGYVLTDPLDYGMPGERLNYKQGFNYGRFRRNLKRTLPGSKLFGQSLTGRERRFQHSRQRKILLAEYRPTLMEWFYFSPRAISA